MKRLRASLRLTLCLAFVAAACAGPAPGPEAVESPRPPATATIALPPPKTPTATPPPALEPSPTAEVTAAPQPFPYLAAGQALQLTRLGMVDARRGWAVHKSEDEIPHVLRTTDGGLTWADVTPPVDLVVDSELGGFDRHAMAAYFLDGEHAWISVSPESLPVGFRSVWRTTDGGLTWEGGLLGRRNYGLDWVLFDFVDALHGWAVIDIFHGAGSHSGELFRTSDGGSTWERLLGDFGYASGIDFVDRQIGWITTDVFAGVSPPWTLSTTQDGGLTWATAAPELGAPVDEPIEDRADCAFRVLHALSARSGVVHRPSCQTVDDQGRPQVTSWLDFTTDAGYTWQYARMPSGTPEFINPRVGWVVGSLDPQPRGQATIWSLFKTVDGGRTWQAVREMAWSGELDFVDERVGWALDEEGRLWHTADGGLSWSEIAPKSAAPAPPQDVTARLDLPAKVIPITLATAPQLQLLATLPADDPTSLTIFRDELFVGNAQGQLLFWALGSQMHLQPKVWRLHSDWVYDLAAVDEGGDLASVSRDGSLRLWPLFSLDGWWQEFRIHTGEVLAAAMAPDESLLASGGQDTTIRVQDLPRASPPKLRFELRGHRGWVWDLAFSSDGALLASASGDRTVKLWSAETGALLATLSGHAATVSQVAIAPDGRQLASASWDGAVRIWDVEGYRAIHTLEGHDDWVLGLAYSPEGDLLVSSSADGTVRVWDPSQGTLLSELARLEAPVRGVGFDSQGRYLVAIADDDRVRIWGIAP